MKFFNSLIRASLDAICFSRFSWPAWLFIFCLLSSTNAAASGFSTGNANTTFSAFNSAFYRQNGTNGYFRNTQTDNSATYFWGQAEMIECVIDDYEWTSNSVCKSMITNLLNGFINDNGTTWTGVTMYNDDIMWAVIAFARGGMDTGNPSYCNIAKANFDACYARAYDTTLGGGLYWSTDDASKNACVNGPGSIAASLLYRIYGDSTYLADASDLYFWERSVLFSTNTGAIYDNIGTDGVVNTWSSTYNQGTFIGAADFLGQTNDAALAANFTMMNLTSGGILPQYGITGNNSGFNAIFLRWLTRFMMNHNLQDIYEPWLQQNAAAAWNARRADGLSWCQWPQPSPAGTNFYAWDCISSFEALAAADPTELDSPSAIPTDYIGYWPLDETSGTVADDISGNGNNGVVSGATWSANGKANGCLSFNGLNNSVQIANPVCNDFSIVFWVKTTQTAGTGQWYNGAGLVDGDAPGVQNDFGTALVGGKFAFGVGNPDTTIISPTSINDGNWHLCVATRQQATGVIKIYVDRTLQATGTGSCNSLTASAHLLFGAIASGGGYFNGSLDEIKIFTRALTSNEVVALYSSSLLPPPNPPANLTAVVGNNQVQLNWGAAGDALSYNIRRALYSGGPYTLLTNTTTTSWTDTNVVNDETYYYVVSAVNSAGESPTTADVSASPSSLVASFEADAMTGLADGEPVAVWPDSSGNGCNAVQPSAMKQPSYVADAMDGQPAVQFNAADENYLWFYRPVQDNFTIICVFQSTQGYGSGNLYYQGAGLVNGEVSGVVNDFGSCLFANGAVCAGTGNPDTAVNSGTGYNDGHPHIMTFIRTESTGEMLLYVDGKFAGGAIGGHQSLTSPNQLVLGAQQVLANYLNGDIAEVQIFNAALSSSERISRENALKCKYSLAGATAPTAPSGLTGSAGDRDIYLQWLLTPGVSSYTLLRSTDGGATYQAAAIGLTNGSYVDTSAMNGQTNYYEIASADDCGTGAPSAATAVYLPLPALGMRESANSLVISWPSWANDWQLYTATNLSPPVFWMPVTNAADANNGELSVTIPNDPGARYFRLGAP